MSWRACAVFCAMGSLFHASPTPGTGSRLKARPQFDGLGIPPVPNSSTLAVALPNHWSARTGQPVQRPAAPGRAIRSHHCLSIADPITYLSIKPEGSDRTCSSGQEEQEGQSEVADHAGAAGVAPALEHGGAYEPSALASLVRAIDHSKILVDFETGSFLYVGEIPSSGPELCAVDDTPPHQGLARQLNSMPLVELAHIRHSVGLMDVVASRSRLAPGNRPRKGYAAG